jgi:hypoxanthine-guanine phosphoribosyltransferase
MPARITRLPRIIQKLLEDGQALVACILGGSLVAPAKLALEPGTILATDGPDR